MSPDWSATAAPVPYAKLDYPQSLNLYAYVENNPLTMADADGHADDEGSCQAGPEACQITTVGMLLDHNIAQSISEQSRARWALAAAQQQTKAPANPPVVAAADAPTPASFSLLGTNREVNYRLHKLNKDGSLGDPVSGSINLREKVLPGSTKPVGQTCTPQCDEHASSFLDTQGVGYRGVLNVERVWTFNKSAIPVWDPLQKSPASAEILHMTYTPDPAKQFIMEYVHP
jgi:hypothetical protein